jgi:hypothetical protein
MAVDFILDRRAGPTFDPIDKLGFGQVTIGKGGLPNGGPSSACSVSGDSGRVVGDQEVIQLGIARISTWRSASVYECGRFTCTIKQHLGQMAAKHVAGLPTQ